MKKRFLSVLLSLAVCMAMIPAVAFAGTEEDKSEAAESNGLYLNQTYNEDENGNAYLELEAYAKGELQQEYYDTYKPCDIVLLLDKSKTMSKYLTVGTTEEIDKLNPEYDTFYSFSQDGHDYQMRYVDGKWQMMKASWKDFDPETAGYGKFKITRMNALKVAADGFVDSVKANADEYDVDYRIGIVSFSTEATVESELVNASQEAEALKSRIDSLSYGGMTATDYALSEAKDMIGEPVEGRNRVVVLFTDGAPTHYYDVSTFSEDEDVTTVVNDALGISKEIKASGTEIYSIGLFATTTDDINSFMNGVSSNYMEPVTYQDLGEGEDRGYYLSTKDYDGLNSVFERVAGDIVSGGAYEDVDSETVVKEVLTDNFTVPAFAEIKAYTADVKNNRSDEPEFKDREEFSGADISVKGNEIKISDFDFSEHWVGIDESDGDRYFAEGQKLIIDIPVAAKTKKVYGTVDICTDKSGIYTDEEQLGSFPVQQVSINNDAFIMDYANKATYDSTAWGQETCERIADKAMSPEAPALKNGRVSLKNNTVSYVPDTIEWDGYDTFYAYGKDIDNSKVKRWNRLSVIPASNIYYEDDYITDKTSGTAGIKYSGEWTVVNSEQPESGDDSQYSDGHAMKSCKGGSMATFTFKGTGIDIISRTDMTSGSIAVYIKGNNVCCSKLLFIDNKAKNGPYYQVPVVSFDNLEYGEYTVQIAVISNLLTCERETFYLDGIKVYNPIKISKNDETAAAAYGDELDAVYTKVKELISKDSLVFVDEDENGDSVVTKYCDNRDNAPANEVYLAPGQSVVMEADSSKTYYIGVRAPKEEANLMLTYGENGRVQAKTIKHAGEKYYRVSPVNGNITIANISQKGENDKDHLIALTKIRTTGDELDNNGISPISEDKAINTVMLLKSANPSLYKETPKTSEELDEELNKEENSNDQTEGMTETAEVSDVVIKNAPKNVSYTFLNMAKKLFRGFLLIFDK